MTYCVGNGWLVLSNRDGLGTRLYYAPKGVDADGARTLCAYATPPIMGGGAWVADAAAPSCDGHGVDDAWGNEFARATDPSPWRSGRDKAW